MGSQVINKWEMGGGYFSYFRGLLKQIHSTEEMLETFKKTVREAEEVGIEETDEGNKVVDLKAKLEHFQERQRVLKEKVMQMMVYVQSTLD